MKIQSIINSLMSLAMSICLSLPLVAQEEFKRGGHRKMEKAKIIQKMDDLSVVQTTLMFKNISKRGIYVTERNALGTASKSGGHSVGAELIAYLTFSDGEPTDAEYQKVVDDFYLYLNKKLKEAGIKTYDWQVFEQSKLYEQYKSDKEEDGLEELNKKGNSYKVVYANGGPRIIKYNPITHYYNAPAVSGTVKMSKYLKGNKINNLGTFHLVVDFADIYLDGDARSGSRRTSYSVTNYKGSNVRYSVEPQVRIAARENGGSFIFMFPKSQQFDEFYLDTDLRAPAPLKAVLDQDASKLKKRGIFSIHLGDRHEIDPFVVETTKEEYFNHVKQALELYADKLAAQIKAAQGR